MWGVEILGNAVETILHQRFLVPAPRPAAVALIVALALLAGLVVAAGGARWRGAARPRRPRPLRDRGPPASRPGSSSTWSIPPAALLLTFAVALAYRVVFEQAEQRRIREAMARYLSPAVSRWVLADPGRLRLGGELREMTVLFSDLRNFTTLAHALAPETLVALLNDHMTEMAAIVFRHDGVLAQYAGDALEAFWNAPMNQPDHARRACAAALDMVAALGPLRPEFAARGWAQLDMGVGINTGRMVVGNMGSRDRLAYTAVGDAVNVAARLEGLSKEYGVRIVIGEATRQAAGDAFEYRFLDLVAVKGRAEPLHVYELLGRAGTVPPDAARGARALRRRRRAVPGSPLGGGGGALRGARGRGARRRPRRALPPAGPRASRTSRRRRTGTACGSPRRSRPLPALRRGHLEGREQHEAGRRTLDRPRRRDASGERLRLVGADGVSHVELLGQPAAEPLPARDGRRSTFA